MALRSTTTPVDPTTGLIDPYAGYFSFLNRIDFRKFFWVTAALLLVVMIVLTPAFGITGDELTQYNYGKAVWHYFSSGGHSKEALGDPLTGGEYIQKKTLEYYGGLFDGLAAMLISVFHPKDEFLLRHYLNAIFGFFALLGTGLLAKEITKKWGVGLLALLLLVCTPRFFGECFNNPKDIPFAAGYIFSIYALVRWLKNLAQPKWGQSIFLGVCIMVGMGVRIGGLLLIVYAAMFYAWQVVRLKLWQEPRALKVSTLQLVVALLIGYLGCSLFWPFALQHPITNPMVAFGKMSHYTDAKIPMLFDGEQVFSQNIPWNYEIKLLLLTMPLFVLLGVAGGIALLIKKNTWQKTSFYPIVVFAALFPVLYISYTRAPVYDGIRHILFAIPPMLVMAAYCFEWAFRAAAVLLKGAKWAPAVALVVLAVLLYSPVRFSIAAHPNEYVYFNEIEGGINAAYGNYETDYYMNSVKEATYKLAKMKNLFDTKDSIIIGTNCIDPVQQYTTLINPKIKVTYVSWQRRYDLPWNYGIFISRYVPKELLDKQGYFPMKNTIATIKADNVVLADIVQRDTMQYEYKGNVASENGDYAAAAQYYIKALALNPENEAGDQQAAFALAKTSQLDAALSYVLKATAADPNDINAHNLAAQIYQSKGDMQHAQQEAQQAQSLTDEMTTRRTPINGENVDEENQ